jgi:hypothetical protein
MTEKVKKRPGAYKIWKNPSRRGEPVRYLGEFYPPAGSFYFSARDLLELGFDSGQYTIRAPEERPFANLISKWQTVTVPE